MDLTQIYMASPDWIKALLIIAPCLTVFGCVTVIGTRWSGRRNPAPPTKIAGYSDAGSLLEAESAARREAREILLRALEGYWSIPGPRGTEPSDKREQYLIKN